MSSGLDPVILQKLSAFSQRRRKLIILRGVVAALAMLLASMMVVALMDWLFVLPDWIRWTLSGIAYLAVVITEWGACLRLLLHAPDERHLARLIEHAEPKLREDLISAVELGQGEATMDSDQFRRLVQSDVANRLEAVNIETLLPVQLLRRTLALASIILVASLAVFAISGFQFGTLLIRAMLPMANLARVSKVQVRIIEPAPADTVAAQGDTVPLIIEVSGQRTQKAVLETFTKDGGRDVVPMVASGTDRFSAAIQVARDNVTYRVRAGDALTRKYELRAAARPQVVLFGKKFRFPEYSKLAPTQVTEESGDLIGLEGSEVELTLQTDQPVKTAELLIDQGKQSSATPLTVNNAGQLTARVALASSGVYRVRLVAASTGFENKFSPEYEIRAEPDLIPQIDLELPKRDLIIPSNEVIEIKGNASDDLGLAQIAQLVRVNEGPWKEFKLDVPLGKTATVNRHWDIYDQGFRAGDLVSIKLVAVDLKGTRAESRPVRLSIIASGFESKRMTSLDSLRQLQASLKALRSAAETLEKRAQDARQRFEQLPSEDPLRRQVSSSFGSGLEEFGSVAANAITQVRTTARMVTPGHSSGELLLLGRLLAKMSPGTFQNAVDLARVLSGNESTDYASDLIREAADACSRVAQRARLADEMCRVLVTSEAIDVLNENIQVVAREQERINSLVQPAADEPERWRPLISRLRVVLAQTKALEELMLTAAETGTDSAPDRLRRMTKEVMKQRESLDRVLEKPDVRMELAAPISNLTKATTDLRRSAFDLKRDYMGPPARVAQNVLQDVQPTWMNFEKLRNEAEAIFRNEKVPTETRTELMQARWSAKGNVLKIHGDAEESRPDADTYFLSDVRAATLALGGLRDTVLLAAKPFQRGESAAESFAILDRSFRILEAAHNLAEIHDGLMRLATAERWEVTALRARTANPRDWEWLESRLRASPEELARLQVNDEPVRSAISAAQKVLREAERDRSWRDINEEMKQRMRPDGNSRPMAPEAERLAALAKQALDLLRDPVESARKSLAQLTPKLSDMMSQLAKEATKLKERSAEEASKAEEKSTDETRAGAKDQLAQQRELNDKLEAIKDALRSDASKQDMLEQADRERARDADDALAMLKEPPPKAENALAEASAAAEEGDQKAALEQASAEQEKLADALTKLSDHYKAMDEGSPEQTRLALREAERQLGAKESLDQRYEQAERLAQLAQSSPEEMLKQLEEALPENPQMQQELSGIAKNTLSNASQKLTEASQSENAVSQALLKLAQDQQAKAAAEAVRTAAQQSTAAAPAANPQNTNPAEAALSDPQRLPGSPNQPQPSPAESNSEKPAGVAQNAQMKVPQNAGQPQAVPPKDPAIAQAASQQTPISQSTTQAGEDVARAGRHEQRLQNTATGQRLENLGNEIRETASNEIAKAQQSLQTRAMATESQMSVDAAKAELQHEVGELASAQTERPAAADLQPGQMQSGAMNTPQEGSQAAASQQPQSPATDAAAQPGKMTPQPTTAQSTPGAPPTEQQTQQGNAANQQSQQQPTGTAPGAAPKPPGPSSPQEQVWMARTLDSLDAALNSTAATGSEEAGEQGKQAQSPPGQQGQPAQNAQGQQQGQKDAMAQAKQAMQSAAQAASAAARSARSQEGQKSQQPSSEVTQGDEQAKSETGALAQGASKASGALPNAQVARTSDWGKLPKKVAEQLTQGQRETVAGEYRNQVETYYRVIAEKAKKP